MQRIFVSSCLSHDHDNGRVSSLLSVLLLLLGRARAYRHLQSHDDNSGFCQGGGEQRVDETKGELVRLQVSFGRLIGAPVRAGFVRSSHFGEYTRQ
jgi:hypothetical protein